MTPPEKPKGPAKPFLGETELSNELDAWDATFDALHDGPAAGQGNEEVMAWPAPAAEPSRPSRVPEPALVQPDASRTLDDFHPELEDQLTLDGALDESTLARTVVPPQRAKLSTAGPRFADTFDSDPAETDFSDVGAAGSPSALGEFLGGTSDAGADAGATRIMPRGATPLPVPVEEEEVYTSASRPNVTSARYEAPLADDPIAPPPVPAPVAARRTGPAIIRRATPAAVPVSKPAHGEDESSAFAENTRVADFGELDQARSDARHKAPTAPPPFAFSPVEAPRPPEEDEYEIEIGADAAPAPDAPEPVAPRRTVAHVLRRPEKSTKPPPPARPASDPVIEVAEAAPVEPAGEDDFSDVAAAVGASDDPIEAFIPRRRPSTPRAVVQAPYEVHDVHEVSPAPSSPDLEAVIDASPSDDHELEMSQLDDAPFIDDMPGETRLDVPRVFAAPPPDLEAEAANAAPRILREPTTPPPEREQSARPPALVDLYPRVKTPTSVPPLGQLRELERGGLAPTRADDDLIREGGDTLGGVGVAVGARPRLQTPMPFGDEAADAEPSIDLEVIQFPEQVQPLPSSQLDEEGAQLLEIYERELATIDDSATSAALRIEAGRLCERLGENDRARSHYDAALLADPRATAALRGLRRIARASGDLAEATRHLDTEIAVAGALERRPLGHYRIDLLLASGEHDLARVAAGEILDSAPSDVRGLLAHLELAFLDGRADEFGSALEQLAHAVTDPELRAAAQSARGVLAAHHNDSAKAATWFGAAAESDPASLGARLGAIRQAAATQDGEATARALIELARQVDVTDPITAAALALRAQHWTGGATATAAAQLAIDAMPSDPLVARLAAETAMASNDPVATAAAMAVWASCPASPAERAYAAARAAELDPARGVELWGAALAHDPGDDYAAAQLRTAHVAEEATQLAIEVDLSVAADGTRERARLRAAFGLIGQGQLDAAIEMLQDGHRDHPSSLALTEALAEALAAAGRWSERARLLAELAAEPGEQLDRDVAQLRSALAWEEAVGAASSVEPVDHEEVQRATAAALEAWEHVLEHAPGPAPTAHAAAIALATRLGDRDVIGEVLARAQAAEQSPWAAGSLALRRARMIAEGAAGDPARAEAVLREATPTRGMKGGGFTPTPEPGMEGGGFTPTPEPGMEGGGFTPTPEIDDPRRTIWLVFAAARRHELADASIALEERATLLGATSEAAALRLRAAQLALDVGDAGRATTLLRAVEQALPQLGIVPDLLAAARRRAGDRPSASAPRQVPSGTTGDAFARIVRDADLAAAQGDGAEAIALYQRALELRPGDPLATLPLVRVATQIREPAPLAALALAQLRAAETAGDAAAKAEAYELLAHIDKELRADPGSAQIALESASQADASRIDLMHRLEREYAVSDQINELLRLRHAELEQIPAEGSESGAPAFSRDRAALVMDTAGLAERDQRPDAELTELYRATLAADPKHRLALLHLESIVRRAGGSSDLAKLEEQIATYFDGDPRTQAAFYTRAGETLAEIGQIDTAVQKFGKADDASPGHVPALEGWRSAALKGQLWIDVADASNRWAAVATDPDARANLHHFAGVALMDKALSGDQATSSFRKALDANPSHKDAFLRLRILLEEDGNHDELAIVLANRLDHEPDERSKVEIHRAVAELHRNFLSDRDTANKHYREILAVDPNDLRAHAAVADIAWELGNWQDAADALSARAKLERDPGVLTTLCYRLGLIYADRLSDPGMALKAFQRALSYQPDDENTLVRLADLATQIGEWKLALGACERLVKSEQDPDKRAIHLHRVAKIFKLGFGDNKRAERALNLALDGAPTNDEALSQLVAFYREAGDMQSVRVHLNRVAGTMRVRVANEPKDGVAYRVIARAMAARGSAGVDGSIPVARAAAELATALGAAGDPERVLLAETRRVDLAPLLRPEADDVLFPRGVQTELRQIFTLLGDRVAKHVGVDLRAYGVARGDRLRAKDSSVAAHAQDVATGLGFGEIDVYVSARQPFVMVAEPTSPVSLVIGQSIAQGDVRGIRFAAGAGLKLAQASLAIPARLPEAELGVLVVALLRQFQTEFPQEGLDEAAIATQMQKLRRLIPTGLMNELKPFALAIDAPHFRHEQLARDLRITGLRAGLVASGSLIAGLAILAAHQGTDVPSFLADPVAQGLVSFALGEDHASIAR